MKKRRQHQLVPVTAATLTLTIVAWVLPSNASDDPISDTYNLRIGGQTAPHWASLEAIQSTQSGAISESDKEALLMHFASLKKDMRRSPDGCVEVVRDEGHHWSAAVLKARVRFTEDFWATVEAANLIVSGTVTDV